MNGLKADPRTGVPGWYYLTRAASTGIVCSSEAGDDFVTAIDGRIYRASIFEDNETHVGNISVKIIRGDLARKAGMPLAGIYSSHELSELYRCAYDKASACLDARVLPQRLTESNTLLLVSRCEVFSRYRGQDIGLKAIGDMIRRFGYGIRLAFIKPFPLQFECETKRAKADERMRLQQLCRLKEEATEKLRRYYARIGFVPLDAGYMYLDLTSDDTVRTLFGCLARA